MSAKLHWLEKDRQRTTRHQRIAHVPSPRHFDIFGFSGMNVGHCCLDFSRIRCKRVIVKRNQFIRHFLKHELRIKICFLLPVKEMPHAHIPLVRDIIFHNLNIPALLSRQVGYTVCDPGGDADQIIRHQPLLKKRIHHSAGEHRTVGASLKYHSQLHIILPLALSAVSSEPAASVRFR